MIKQDLRENANHELYSLRRDSSVQKLREIANIEQDLLKIANIELYVQENHIIKIDLRKNHKVEPYSLRRNITRIEYRVNSMVRREIVDSLVRRKTMAVMAAAEEPS